MELTRMEKIMFEAKYLLSRMRGNNSTFGKQQLKNTAVQSNIAASFSKNRAVILLYFDIVSFHEVEQLNNPANTRKILTIFKKTLEHETTVDLACAVACSGEPLG